MILSALRLAQRIINAVFPPLPTRCHSVEVFEDDYGRRVEIIYDDPVAEIDIADVVWPAPEGIVWKAALADDGTIMVYDQEQEAWVEAP